MHLMAMVYQPMQSNIFFHFRIWYIFAFLIFVCLFVKWSEVELNNKSTLNFDFFLIYANRPRLWRNCVYFLLVFFILLQNDIKLAIWIYADALLMHSFWCVNIPHFEWGSTYDKNMLCDKMRWDFIQWSIRIRMIRVTCTKSTWNHVLYRNTTLVFLIIDLISLSNTIY